MWVSTPGRSQVFLIVEPKTTLLTRGSPGSLLFPQGCVALGSYRSLSASGVPKMSVIVVLTSWVLVGFR